MKSFEFTVEERIYKNVENRDLKLYIFNPQNLLLDRTAILFFHGGSYVKSDRTPLAFEHHAELYASKGIVAICVDYRTTNDTEAFSPLYAISDAKSSIQWVRQHHQELGVNSNKIIICGASSGGFTVLCSVLVKDVFELEGDYTNNIPDALVMFNPGVDGVEVLNRLFPELSDKAENLSPLHNIVSDLPPLILFIGTDDIIYGSNKEFYEKWIEYGNQCTFHTYEGMSHGFFNYGTFDNKPFKETNEEIEKFMKTLGLL
ncbi:alpha/beta hydrolase fold domain-containing protein [Bacillaceae bacterium CLA-AA-H227]|uniref:Alpha/beta hydrolase fold domain-containing protein n=1 Tax=Robertmurraya yapensis (ex Hitch et al 2024) TaxID=3133160 RepID=A0ACC6S5I6_9BACI|nr:alpha/beta hydrolase fold domain-containing protein [Bacillus yapensis]